MTIKDFEVGQTVFVMGDYRTQRNKFRTTEAEVVKVGRKYVTINGNWGIQFKETASSRPYLHRTLRIRDASTSFPVPRGGGQLYRTRGTENLGEGGNGMG